jgi:hypothetical protein
MLGVGAWRVVRNVVTGQICFEVIGYSQLATLMKVIALHFTCGDDH